MSGTSYERASATEIDRKLRNDFRLRLQDYGYTAEASDPVLAVLFRSIAAHIERLYSDADQMRLALLDELIAGLGMAHRAARAAQTVVRFSGQGSTTLVPAGTELAGVAVSGERITFTTDAPLAVSSARLALCLLYEPGQIRLFSGLEMSEELAAAGPSLVSVPAELGPTPCIFLAVENLDESHLSRHGLFVETRPAAALRDALVSEPWCLARSDGTFSGEALLKTQRGNAGVRELRWLVGAEAAAPDDILPELPNGFYGGQTFLFPSIPPKLRYRCGAPRGMEPILPKLFHKPANLFARPRAWIRIGLPPGLPDLVSGISNIFLHAVSASNLECLNQTVHFEQDGTSIPVSREAGARKFLVSPLSVIGESGSEYFPELSPHDSHSAGRYSIRNGRMRLQPGGWGGGQTDRYANVRLWMTDGVAGNAVGAGQVQSFLRPSGSLDLRVLNPVAAAGGSDSESYAEAQDRLAHTLLSRDRLVTRADLLATVRAFDRRIQSAALSFELRRTPQGLQRAHVVTAKVSREQFLDFPQESRILGEELAAFLEQRSLFDVPVIVTIQGTA
jgi:hypothetical protein